MPVFQHFCLRCGASWENDRYICPSCNTLVRNRPAPLARGDIRHENGYFVLHLSPDRVNGELEVTLTNHAPPEVRVAGYELRVHGVRWGYQEPAVGDLLGDDDRIIMPESNRSFELVLREPVDEDLWWLMTGTPMPLEYRRPPRSNHEWGRGYDFTVSERVTEQDLITLADSIETLMRAQNRSWDDTAAMVRGVMNEHGHRVLDTLEELRNWSVLSSHIFNMDDPLCARCKYTYEQILEERLSCSVARYEPHATMHPDGHIEWHTTPRGNNS